MKNIKALLGSLAIAAILGANGYVAMDNCISASELTLDGVESLANGGENSAANVVYIWIEEIPVVIEYYNFVQRRQVGVCRQALSRKSSNCAYDGQFRVWTIDIY